MDPTWMGPHVASARGEDGPDMDGTVPGFRPSTHGLHYPNNWPEVPAKTIRVHVAGVTAEIPLGDASGGLCGGMVFAVRDLFERSTPPPDGSDNPPPGSPAFDFIVDRLFASLRGPRGAAFGARYYEWMLLPDRIPVIKRGVADLTVHDSLRQVRDSIDRRQPAPLGLVCAASANPRDLGNNHQVLAYAHETGQTQTVLHLYDPNWPDQDDVTLTCALRDGAAHPFAYSTGDHAVRGFFVSEYEPADPGDLFRTTAQFR